MSKETNLIYAGIIGAALGDLIPTVADAFYFKNQRVIKQKLEKGEITPSQYWRKDAFAYYGYNFAWWMGVLGISFAAGKTFEQKRNILIGLVAGGSVVAVIYKNIKKDEEFYSSIL